MEATTESPRWIGPVDTAKLLRKALREAFPETKFSVRTSKYAGGASIRVEYTDGPMLEAVEHIANRFEGATFDPMIDLKGYKRSVHEDEWVQFGADFVFVNRNLTVPALQRIADSIGWINPDIFEIVEGFDGAARVKTDNPEVQGAIFRRSKETDLRSQEVAA